MNQIVIAASAVTITVLAVKLHNRTKDYNNLVKNYNKLLSWSEIAGRTIKETAIERPNDLRMMSDKLAIDMNCWVQLSEDGLI